MPVIWYMFTGKKRRYFPDFYIPKDNLVIEVKSRYTYKRSRIQNIIKALNTRKHGFKYETWIVDPSKSCVTINII